MRKFLAIVLTILVGTTVSHLSLAEDASEEGIGNRIQLSNSKPTDAQRKSTSGVSLVSVLPKQSKGFPNQSQDQLERTICYKTGMTCEYDGEPPYKRRCWWNYECYDEPDCKPNKPC